MAFKVSYNQVIVLFGEQDSRVPCLIIGSTFSPLIKSSQYVKIDCEVAKAVPFYH